MQFTCDRNELTGAIERVAHAISDGLTGNGSQTAEENTTAQEQTQTEELNEQTEQDSSGTMNNTENETAADILNEAAIAARRAYFREYRARNRDRLNARQRQWHKEHPEKTREYLERYWLRKAAEMLAEQQSRKLFLTVSDGEVVEDQSGGEV